MKKLLSFLIAFLVLFTTQSYAQQLSIAAPLAAFDYCNQKVNKMDCEESKQKIVILTKKRLTEFEYVNAVINGSMKWQSDSKYERWSSNCMIGDCEDFAVCKRRILIRVYKWPASALRLQSGWVYVRGRWQAHMRLIALTNRGILIADYFKSEFRISATQGTTPIAFWKKGAYYKRY